MVEIMESVGGRLDWSVETDQFIAANSGDWWPRHPDGGSRSKPYDRPPFNPTDWSLIESPVNRQSTCTV